MSSASGRDTIANNLLRESYQDILDLLNVGIAAPALYSRGRITLPELDQLQNMAIYTDNQARRHFLYSTALADKGQEGLDTFLGVLRQTVGHAPHAQLLDRLSAKLRAHDISPSTAMSTRPTEMLTRGAELPVTDADLSDTGSSRSEEVAIASYT